MGYSRWRRGAAGALLVALTALCAPAPAWCQEASDAATTRRAAPSLSDIDIDALLSDAPLPPPPVEEPAQLSLPTALRRLIDDVLGDEASARADALLADLAAATRERLPAQVHDALAALPGASTDVTLQAFAVLALLALVAVLLCVRFLIGRGDLAVNLEYPSELRGTFTVRLASSRARAKAQMVRAERIKTSEAARRAERDAEAGSRRVHFMVSRETQFRNLPVRRLWVTISGFLQSADGHEVLGGHIEMQEVRLRRGRTVRVAFDLYPECCPVDVKVTWDRRRVSEALVAIRNLPATLRYARSGPVRIGVPPGSHTLIVGSADRVAEHPLTVDSFQPQALTVDLTGRENMLFTGCPPAVEPYLHGDVAGAARALEQEGQSDVANLMLARHHLERGQRDVAARHFERAGQDVAAAEIHRELANFEQSAVLYDNAGETAQAAAMYRSAGDLVRAGEAYERASRFDSAVECYREAGEVEKWITSLDRLGRPFEAAEVAIKHEDWSRAIRSLRLVGPDDPHYGAAANLLVDAYLREGHLDLAADVVDALIRTLGAEEIPLAKCDDLASQLATGGNLERAIDMLDVVRRRDATYPNIGTRIEELRKRIDDRSSSERNTDIASGSEGFAEGFRYEILEEIGRGGMGIVFKARDRRLGRIVALKRLPDNLRNHQKAVNLFLREARAAAALNHPNIVTLFDAGRECDTFYITMELLEGSPLQNILHKRGKLTPRDVARVGIQIAAGLQYAHEQRIIHRDIKTGNLFFTRSKKVKIMDFGLAKMVEEVRRASTVIGGTPYYMAPEQSLGRSVDARADLYALGVTFFELLTGKVPFTEGDVAYQHRHTPPPDPRERAPEIPDAMAELVLHLLEKDPDRRCAEASEVSRRLQEIARELSADGD